MGRVHSIGFLQEQWAVRLIKMAQDRFLNDSAWAHIRASISKVLPEGMHEDEVDKVEYVLNELIYSDQFKRTDPLIVSLLRLEHEEGVDLLQPFAGKLTAEERLCAIQALGVIALAWQHHVHPNDLALSVREYRKQLGID